MNVVQTLIDNAVQKERDRLRECLDDGIERWRHVYQTDPDRNVIANHYIDAFQSIRVSILGRLKV